MKIILQSFIFVFVLARMISCQSNLPTNRPPQTETPTPPVIGTATPFTFHTVTPNPSPTSVEVTSFETCAVSSGSWLDGTYPRKCRTKNGKIFNETVEEGITYSKTYGTRQDRTGYFITSTNDGGHLIAGASGGCWILKLDASGEKEWESDFDQELSEEFNLSNSSFWCRLARETTDGGYTAMGMAYDWNFGQYRKPFMVTLDHEGNLLSAQLLSTKGEKVPYLDRLGKPIWLTSLGLTPLGIPREVYDTLDGGYLIVGSYEQSTPDSNTHMLKTDQDGKYVWDKNLCRDKKFQQKGEKGIFCSPQTAWDAVQLQDGSYAAVGGGWLLKTDANGNIEWIQRFSAEGFSLLAMPDGSFLIAGEKDVDQNKKDGILIKVDSAGNVQWQKTFGGDQDDGFRAMEQGPHGEITVIGWTKSVEIGTYLWLLGIDSKLFK